MPLHPHLLEVTAPGIAYICLGGFAVLFSVVSLLVKEKANELPLPSLPILTVFQLYINEVLLGTIFGIIVGPYGANIFNPRAWGDEVNEITLEVMRIILATGLFAIGVELPGSYMAKHARGLLVLVVPTMAFGWVVVAGIMYGLFPPLSFISCLAIAACLTPTDPIISATIVGGRYAIKHVPRNIRQIIAAESAANDGLAYPFLSISIYLTIEQSRRVAVGEWFLVGWLYQVIFGILLGALLGIAFSYLIKLSHRKGFLDRESYVAQYLALAIFTTGIASTLGTDDLLAAFACGNAISWDQHFNEIIENESFSSVIDLVLNCGCFVYIGAWLPFSSFDSPDLGITPARLAGLFLCILALRRIPSVLLLYRWVPEIENWKEALFTGHFGPMGVGAIFVSSLAVKRLPHPHDPPANQQELLAATLQPIVSFVVLGSIIVHGLSIPFFTLGGNMHMRTRSLLATLTSTRGDPTDWLLSLRRGPPVVPVAPTTTADSDLEAGIAREVQSASATIVGGGILEEVNVIEKERAALHPAEEGGASGSMPEKQPVVAFMTPNAEEIEHDAKRPPNERGDSSSSSKAAALPENAAIVVTTSEVVDHASQDGALPADGHVHTGVETQ
ncbi:Na-H-Exchanger domain-containing protein [Mycena indigotica]|uniref:Na-H-Exchanger domain-containing protein n=1 Tax=Mycena indigotica TaxID=2126181 RepID=A0A8H6SFG2_9AGAR|nr:Na-H-Exchanger domain-containing protein [Mycena indigotica]KAF7296875.1 Na-H-Exchanger domain-containing protein [Mycena indigotica]